MTKISMSGYKKHSKDKNEPALVIPSNQITMKGVDFPVYGTDDTGHSQMMYPGLDYSFPGSYVHEIPMAQGGYIVPGRFKNPEGNWLNKYQKGGTRQKIYNDPIEFARANRNYNDSLEGFKKYPLAPHFRSQNISRQEFTSEDNPATSHFRNGNYSGANILNSNFARSLNISPSNIQPTGNDYEWVYKRPTQQPVYKEKPVEYVSKAAPIKKEPIELVVPQSDRTLMPYNNTLQVLHSIQHEDRDKQGPKVVPAPEFRSGGWLDKYQDGSQVPANFPWINQQGQYKDPNGVGPTVQKAAKLKQEKLKQAVRNSPSMQLPSGAITPVMGPIEYALMAPVAGASAMRAAPIIGSALNAPIAGVSGATVGNALGALGATDAIVNRLPEIPGQVSRGEYKDAAINALTGGLDLFGANMVSPLYKGVKAAAQKTGDFLTTQTPLQYTHLINPWSFHRRVNKTNPSTDFVYRTLGRQEGFENTVNSGFITPKPGGKYTAAFYNPGYPLLRYDDWSGTGSRYIAEVPMSNPKIMSRFTDKLDPYRVTRDIDRGGLGHVGINEPDVTIYKEDWLQGYKQINKSKQLPGSPNNTASDRITGPGPLMLGLSKFTHEVKNPAYFQKMLDSYSTNKLSNQSKQYFQGIIKSVEKQGGLATRKQYDMLQRLRTGDFNYGKKEYGGSLDMYQDGSQVPQSWKDKYDWTPNVEEEYMQFKNDPNAPENLRFTDDMKDYNTRGMWDSLDRPSNWQQALDLHRQQQGYEWTPEDDGYYHAWSQHPGTGEWLKPRHHSTGWMNNMGYAFDPENTVVVNPEGFFGNETLQAYPKQKKNGGESQGEGYYNYIKDKGSNAYSGTFANGGVSSKQSSWLNKYK